MEYVEFKNNSVNQCCYNQRNRQITNSIIGYISLRFSLHTDCIVTGAQEVATSTSWELAAWANKSGSRQRIF